MKNVAAILLAAGRSKRMGAFKPLLPFGDRSIITTCIDQLRAAGIETIIVVLGHRAEELRKHLTHANVRFAINEDPTTEMSTSIARGVEELPPATQAVILALGDHPVLDPEVIATLLKHWAQGGKLLIPEYAGRGGHPVLVDLDFRTELLQLDSERGLKGLFKVHRSQTRRIPVTSPLIARDLDTWDDYRALHQEVFGEEPSVALPNGESLVPGDTN